MAKPRKPRSTRSTRANAGARIKSSAQDSGKIEEAEVVSEGPGEAAASAATGTGTGTEASKPAAGEAQETAAVDSAETAATGVDDGPAAKSSGSEKPDEPALDAEKPAEAPETTDGESPAKTGESDADKGEEPGLVAPFPETSNSAPEDKVAESRDTAADLPRSVAPAPVQPPARGGGFGSMVFGGIIAAALGAGALYLADSQGWVSLGGDTALKTTLSTQSAKIDALQSSLQTAHAEIEALRVADVGITKVNERVDGLSAVVDGLSETTATLGKQLEDTNTRITEVSTEPIPAARLPEQVTAAYEAKFTALQGALEERNKALQAEQDAKLAAIEAKLDTRLAEMAVVQDAAAQAEEAALAAEKAATMRAALADIDMALDTGTSFGPALETLAETGTDMPETLSGLADGSAATLTQLQASFPAAARAALVASTRAGAEDGSVGGVTAFFRTQLGARSLEPREGGDPDAVLSRAEAAVKRGDLATALTEISALPEAGQAALADWRSQAETRLAAKADLAALSDQLNSN